MNEKEFLISYKATSDRYPRPSLTADISVFARDGKTVKVLLVRRGRHPFKDYWALPGGFVRPDETVQESAARELAEETGIRNRVLIPVNIYSTPGRDPRGWTVSMLYTCEIDLSEANVAAGDDAAQAKWFNLATAMDMKLAFDHAEMLREAAEKAGLP